MTPEHAHRRRRRQHDKYAAADKGIVMKRSRIFLAGAVAAALVGSVSATPYPHGPAAAATDVGPASAFAENEQVTVTVALRLRNTDQMEQLIESVYTRGSAHYQAFLTPEQFRAQFGPSPATVAAVTQHFAAQGLNVTQSATAHLQVSGSAAQIEKAFAVQLHSFAVPASGSTPEYRFRAPLGAPQVPAAIAGSVRAVLGLDTKPRFRPHLKHAFHIPQQPSSRTNTTNPPGLWTVQDYAQYYNVNPLYAQGLSGRGRTVGIVTLASFTPSDAFEYWHSLGLSVSAGRITQVKVDGGSGPPSDESGSDETTLDVQQSGGLAPGAHIIVYEAPNTNQGFVDAFAAAIDGNRADTVSTSWGEWEGFDGPDPVIGNGPVNNPTTGEMTTSIQALDDLLAQGALQGQSWFTSTGDFGAYDADNSLPIVPQPPDNVSFNSVLSVDDPAVQRFITAAGGTTLPGQQIYAGPTGKKIVINVPQERVWGWDYLERVCRAFQQDPITCGIFPFGTGGGVSIYVLRPFYQLFTRGMADTVAGQTLVQLTPPPPQTLFELPAGFPGRNIPDLSTNADPQTGYIIPYTSNHHGFEILQGGGTSFVAPQLNGVTNLYAEALHHRIGLLNPALYFIAAHGGYNGRQPALRDMKQGNNWFWRGRPGYDQGTGVGVPDVANLLERLRGLEP
jgi:subtilase family serine protease